MKSKAMQERIKSLLKETITLLCKNGLEYRSQFCIEALIGITLDEEDIVLVNINETVSTIVAEADSAHVAMSSGASVSLCSHTEDGPDLDSHSRSHRHRRKTKRHSTDRGPTPKKLLKGSPSPRSQASTFRERDVNSSSRHGRQLTLRPHVDTTENDDSKSDIVYIKEEPEDDNDRNGEAVWSSVTPASLSMSLPLNPPLASSESRTAHPVSEGNIHMLGNSGDEKIKIEGVARWVAQQQFQQEQDEGGNLGAPEGTTVSSAQHGPPREEAGCVTRDLAVGGMPSYARRPSATLMGNHGNAGPASEATAAQSHAEGQGALSHFPSRIPPTPKKPHPAKRCRICYKQHSRRKETTYCCLACPNQPGLCPNYCFQLYHAWLASHGSIDPTG